MVSILMDLLVQNVLINLINVVQLVSELYVRVLIEPLLHQAVNVVMVIMMIKLIKLTVLFVLIIVVIVIQQLTV